MKKRLIRLTGALGVAAFLSLSVGTAALAIGEGWDNNGGWDHGWGWNNGRDWNNGWDWGHNFWNNRRNDWKW